MSAPTIDRLSFVIAQANGSLVSAAAEDERPQATRPCWPSTMWVALDLPHARRIVGGLWAGVG
jgi:hypothetical protein